MKSTTIVIALLLLVAGHACAEDLRTVDGGTVSGAVSRITEAEIVLKTDAGEVATPFSKVLALDLRPARPPDASVKYTALRLIDDTLLACQTVALRGKEVEATLLSGLTIKLPLGSVVSLLADAGSKDFQKRWPEISSPKIKRDRIVIMRDGEPNVVEGNLGEADFQGKTIQFKVEGTDKVAPLPLERVHALVFWRPDPSPETPICKVIDRDGNRLYAVKLGFYSGILAVETTFGAKIPFKTDLLARLDFNLGKLTYLSDLEPTKIDEKLRLQGFVFRHKKDTSFDGEPIVLDNKQYAKGLWLHAYTELEYNLGGKFKDLKGVLGVDPRFSETAEDVLVTIYCDGEKRFSETMTQKAAQPLVISVKDVQTLRIVVNGRDFTDLSGHVTFADARVNQ